MKMKLFFSAIGLAALAGCATVPTGPSVMVLPGSNKPFDVFRAEDSECRQYASYAIGGQVVAANDSAGRTAVGGTLLGAAAGAAIGAASGQAGSGAAVGAGLGLLFGGLASSDGGSNYDSQRRYDSSYIQCMYAKGNQVPMRGGYRGAYRAPAPAGYPAPPAYVAPPPG